jgi:hypothetical protein
MHDGSARPAAWVIAVRMGYGHQRTAHPLRGLAPNGDVLFADDYPGIPDRDKALWQRTRRFYEFISNAQQVPVVGQAMFAAFDVVQTILHFYPRRDLSRPDWNIRALYALIRRGWGRDLIERLKAEKPVLPIVTSFYTPAFMAEFFDYPGDIYCVICDADIARAWAPLAPSTSRIKYFAPTRRAAERLSEYGVRPPNVVLSGYPLPLENVGGPDMSVLRTDLAGRMVVLDPAGEFRRRYGSLVTEKVGALPDGPRRPLTILFSVGGAGAQKEIASDLLRSLAHRIAHGEVRVIVSAGIKPGVRDYALRAAAACGLTGALSGATGKAGGGDGNAGVEVLFAEHVTAYFDLFNRALRTTDVLWTKPSELSFYSALGLPVVFAPTIGAQEKANREWLLRLGAAMVQDDPALAHEWLFDLLASGWFAEAALEGFVEGEPLATRRIIETLTAGAQRAGAAPTDGSPWAMTEL